jgi:hypothetical protein
MSITESECVFVALGVQHAMHMRHTVTCGLPDSTKLSSLSHKQHDFSKNLTENKMCVLIFSKNFI